MNINKNPQTITV